jgi:hypothetical protein
MYLSKLNFKVPNIYINPLLNSIKTYNKHFLTQKYPGPLKSSPNDEISPNLVTQQASIRVKYYYSVAIYLIIILSAMFLRVAMLSVIILSVNNDLLL